MADPGQAVIVGRRPRLNRIASLALPIVGGMVSQNILNLVDTAMVGVLGAAALAAVGIGGFTSFMATAMVMGLGSAVQAIVARRVGQGRGDEAAVPLAGGLLLAAVIGVPVSIVLIALAPSVLGLVNQDPVVVTNAVPYFEWRLAGVVAIGMNFSFRGFWTGISRPRVYFTTLVFVHVANVAISYVLIFGHLGLPALGTEGAGIGTTASLFLGTLIHITLGYRYGRQHGFSLRLPRAETLRTMLRLSVPMTVQQMLFAAGLTAFFWLVGQVGTAELAVSNVLVNLLLVAILPAIALGLTALTLVGESLGREQPNDASRWGYEVAGVAAVLIALLGVVAVAVPDMLLAGFLHDPEYIDLGRNSLRLVGATMWVDGAGMVLMHALLGAGMARRVMVVAVGTQWLIGLPLTWLVGPALGWGLTAIWGAQAAYRFLQAVVFFWVWRSGAWSRTRI